MLEYLKNCIEEKKSTNIVYLGGSITEGQGVSDKRLCWQGLLQSFLENSFPVCCFQAVNAGIGGTDSGFGAFRMERDVLPYEPDLLFVEYAVNDYMKIADAVEDALEGILYKLWNSNSQADVIFVLTTTEKMAVENYDKGQLPESVAVHCRVADRYGIPYLNVGSLLLEHCKKTGEKLTHFLPDTVHPGKEGYRMYFTFLKEQLTLWLKEEGRCGEEAAGKTEAYLAARKRLLEAAESAVWEKASEERSGETMNGRRNPYFRCRMANAHQAVLQGFVKEYIAMCGRFAPYVSSCRQGDLLEFAFEGDKIGIFYMVSSDGGMMEWSLDGGEWNMLSAWDTYARAFDRGSVKMLAEGLETGEHVLRIRSTGEKMTESCGNFIRIADFLL